MAAGNVLRNGAARLDGEKEVRAGGEDVDRLGVRDSVEVNAVGVTNLVAGLWWSRGCQNKVQVERRTGATGRSGRTTRPT